MNDITVDHADANAAPTRRRSRRKFGLRFSLSTLFILMTVAAVWVRLTMHRPITVDNVAGLTKIDVIDDYAFRIVPSPNGARLAMFGWATPVRIYNARTLTCVEVFGKDKGVIDWAYSPDGRWFAYGENDTKVHVVDTQTNDEVTIDTGDSQPDIVFTPDSTRIVTGGYAESAKLWDVATGKMIREFKVNTGGSGLNPVLSPDGKTLVVGDRNADTEVFDLETGRRRYRLAKRSTHGIDFHPDGNTFAVGYVDGSIAIYRTSDGQQLHSVNTGASEVYDVLYSPDAKMLISNGRNSKVLIYDPATLKLIHSLPAPEWVIDVAFTPDGTRLLVSGGSSYGQSDRRVEVWGLKSALFDRQE